MKWNDEEEFTVNIIKSFISDGSGMIFALEDLYNLHGVDIHEILIDVESLVKEFNQQQPRKKRNNLNMAFHCMRNKRPFGKYEKQAIQEFEQFLLSRCNHD